MDVRTQWLALWDEPADARFTPGRADSLLPPKPAWMDLSELPVTFMRLAEFSPDSLHALQYLSDVTTWTADGWSIQHEDSRNVWLIDPAAGKAEVFLSPGMSASFQAAVWTSATSFVLYGALRTGGEYRLAVWRGDLDSGTLSTDLGPAVGTQGDPPGDWRGWLARRYRQPFLTSTPPELPGSRMDRIPPARIGDLALSGPPEEGEREPLPWISWTAPGDDGDRGRAMYYELVIAESSMLSRAWDSAEPILGVPLPDSSGTRQFFQLPRLVPGRRYFLTLRSDDDAGNRSGISNELVLTYSAYSDTFSDNLTLRDDVLWVCGRRVPGGRVPCRFDGRSLYVGGTGITLARDLPAGPASGLGRLTELYGRTPCVKALVAAGVDSERAVRIDMAEGDRLTREAAKFFAGGHALEGLRWIRESPLVASASVNGDSSSVIIHWRGMPIEEQVMMSGWTQRPTLSERARSILRSTTTWAGTAKLDCAVFLTCRGGEKLYVANDARQAREQARYIESGGDQDKLPPGPIREGDPVFEELTQAAAK